MLLGIIDPSIAAPRRVLGHDRPLDAAREVGYLPEERGLYPAMTRARRSPSWARCAACRSREGRRRADELLAGHGLGDWATQADPHPVEGHGADRPVARHHRPPARG